MAPELLAAIFCALAAPLVTVAQATPSGRVDRGFGLLWLLAAVLVGVALFRLFFGRTGRQPPSSPLDRRP